MENHKKSDATADTSPIRKQESWARSEEGKTKTFVEHLSKVFKLREITQEEENRLLSNDTIPATQDTSTRLFIINEVKAVIKRLNPKKTRL